MNLKKKLAALKKPAHKAAPPTRKPFLVPPRTKSAPSDDSAHKLMLDDLRKSGLNADDAKRLQLRPYSAKESEVLNLPRGADAGYKIPYFDSRGKLLSMFRYRYFKTVSDSGFTAGAELRRYDQPDNTPVEIYLPRGYVDWDEIELLILTEGEKKAACATKNEFPCIGLGGVWSFGRGKGDRRLHLALAPYIKKGLAVYICYDSDAATNSLVMGAENCLARELSNAGAVVYVVRIPPDGNKKVGLDDFIVKHGTEAFKELLKSTREWEQDRELHELNARYVVCRDTAAICEVATRRMYAADKFLLLEATRNYRQPDATGKMRELNGGKEWLKWPQRGEVDGVTYDPGQPRIFEGKLNQWSDAGIEPHQGDTAPFDELFQHLVPETEKRTWVLGWAAHPLQHRGERNNAAVMVWSLTQGQGKSLLGETIGRLHGRENYIEIGTDQIASDFNEWQPRKTFVMGSELCGPSSRDARSFADKMKSLITASEISINEKYEKTYAIPNRVNFFLTSNHPTALHLTKEARRYFVVHATESKLPQEFYTRFLSWRENGGLSALLYKMLHVDLSGFNPGADAPRTADMQEMIAAGRSDLQDWCHDLKEDSEATLQRHNTVWVPATARFATSQQLLKAYLARTPDARINQQQMSQELSAAGFVRANGGVQIRVGDRKSERRERLWILREEKKAAKMTPEQIAREWMKGGIR